MASKQVPTLEFQTLNGETLRLEEQRGRVLLLVNTASKCGFTGQYQGLEQLHRDYGKQGLQVIAFPCNDFMGQEPGSSEEILDFCTTSFDVTFPVVEKLHVKGDKQHPLYHFLTAESPQALRGEVKWNFTKFLVDREGRVIARFEPAVDPQDPELVAAVKAALSR